MKYGILKSKNEKWRIINKNDMKDLNKAEIHNIFRKIKNGEKEAIEELYVKYQKLVINISFSIVKDKTVAEEITQIVFLKIIQLPKEKLPIQKELNWLYSVTKNQSIEFLRQKRNMLDIDVYEIEDTNNEINEVIDSETFNNLINCLDDIEKEIVSLKILANFTFKEIGQILEIPTGTVQWKYYKSINTLKILLSNLLMFIISFSLYLHSKNSTIENDGEQTGKDNQLHNSGLIDSMNPSAMQGSADTSTSSIQSINLQNSIEIGLFGLSSIFLVITIIFGIIFAKHQQKRHKKSSK